MQKALLLILFIHLISCSEKGSNTTTYINVSSPEEPHYVTLEKEGEGTILVKEDNHIVSECSQPICSIPITNKILSIHPQPDYTSKFESWDGQCSVFNSECYIFPSNSNQQVKIKFSKKWNQPNGGNFNYDDIQYLEYISDERIIIWSPSFFIKSKLNSIPNKDPNDKPNTILIVNPKTNQIIETKTLNLFDNAKIIKIKKKANRYYFLAEKKTSEYNSTSIIYYSDDLSSATYYQPVTGNSSGFDLDNNLLVSTSGSTVFFHNLTNNTSTHKLLEPNLSISIYNQRTPSLNVWISNQRVYIFQNEELLRAYNRNTLERDEWVEDYLATDSCHKRPLSYSNENKLFFLCGSKLTIIDKTDLRTEITLNLSNFTTKTKYGYKSMTRNHSVPNSRVLSVWEIGNDVFISKKTRNTTSDQESSILKFSRQGELNESFPQIDIYPSFPVDFLSIENNSLKILGSFKYINGNPSGMLAQVDLGSKKTTTYAHNLNFGLISQYNPKVEPVKMIKTHQSLLILGNFEYYNNEKVKPIFSINTDGTINRNFNLSPLPGLGYDFFVDTYFEPIFLDNHIIIRFRTNDSEDFAYPNFHEYNTIYKFFNTSGIEVPAPSTIDFTQYNTRLLRDPRKSNCFFVSQNNLLDKYCNLVKVNSFIFNLQLLPLAENQNVSQIFMSARGYFVLLNAWQPNVGIKKYITRLDLQGQEFPDNRLEIKMQFSQPWENEIITTANYLAKKDYSNDTESFVLLVGNFISETGRCNFLELSDLEIPLLKPSSYCSLNSSLYPSLISKSWTPEIAWEAFNLSQSVMINNYIYITGHSFVWTGSYNREYTNLLMSFNPSTGMLNPQFIHEFRQGLNSPSLDNNNYLRDIIYMNGYLFVAGQFDHYRGTPVSGFIRLNLDGSLAD